MAPWEELNGVWKTESAFMGWIRGGIRRSLWNRSPIKLEFIKRNRVRIPNPNPRGNVKEVWGGICALTGLAFPLKDLEVDHKTGGHSLRSIGDIQNFVEGIVLVSVNDLQFVSKDAHKVKSYAERCGISYDEAKAHKKAIDAEKKGTKFVLDFLRKVGYTQPGKNKDVRRIQLIEHFKGETK